MPYIYFGLILFMSIKAQKAVQELHLEKDDKSEIILKTYSKAQIKIPKLDCVYRYSDWLLYLTHLS